MAARIRRDDVVVVIAGKDKGKRGRVMKVFLEKNRVMIEGVNRVVRHRKANPQNPSEGGRVTREAPIHLSNVMPWSDKDGKGVRVKVGDENGQKIRLSAASGQKIKAAAPPAASDDKPGKSQDGDKE
ncbi:MAG: 50S ribosomal protein L24 [Planctomycetes bacterium]|nr:50S ribosomal protein L24 [Planctomycetota bacterium]